MAGTREVSERETFRDLRAAGVVATGYGEIVILDAERLLRLPASFGLVSSLLPAMPIRIMVTGELPSSPGSRRPG